MGFLSLFSSDSLVEIKVGSKKFGTDENICLESVMVEKSIGFEASIAEIVIIGARKEVSGKSNKIFSALKLTEEIEIGMKGKDDKSLKCVFFGFVLQKRIEVDQDEAIKLIVTCGDVKNVMMNYAHFRSFDGCTKYSEVATNVLSLYKDLCMVNVQNSLPISRQIVQSGQSDYDFLVEIAKKTASEFFVENGIVNFVPISPLSKIISIGTGNGVSSTDFLVTSGWLSNSCYKKKDKVTVFSQDIYDEKTLITGICQASGVSKIGKGDEKYGSLSKWVSDGDYEIIDNSVLSAKEAADLAEAQLTRDSMDFVEFCCKIDGFLFLELGSMTAFKDFDIPFDGKYKISKLKYSVSNDEVKSEIYGRSNTLCTK